MEFTMRLSDYAALGGHMDAIIPLSEAVARASKRLIELHPENPWPIVDAGAPSE
jgi:6-hydroxynicotinate reductase